MVCYKLQLMTCPICWLTKNNPIVSDSSLQVALLALFCEIVYRDVFLYG